MDGADQSANAPKLSAGISISVVARTRQHFKKFGTILASIAAVGAVAGGLAGYWRAWDVLYSHTRSDASAPAQSPSLIVTKGPAVAVLPFANPAKATALDPFADIVTQQVASSLGKFSTLRVTPRALSANLSKDGNTIEAARKAGIDYLVTGEVRPSGDGARANIQIADLKTGSELWSRSFDASAQGVQTETDAYEIGDVAAAQIGGYPGPIMSADFAKLQHKDVAEFGPYECIVYALTAGATGSSAVVLKGLECSKQLTDQQPNNALALAARSVGLYMQRFLAAGLPMDQVNHSDKRLYLNEEIVRTAARAVELAPDDAYVRRAYALAISTKCQLDLYRQEARKAIALNPNDARSLGALGNQLAFMGDWDEGAAMAEKGIRLAGPSASFAWWYAPAKRHWWRGEYEQSVEDFRHGYLEGFWLSHLDQAYALPFLGRIDEAKAEVAKLLKLRPDFSIHEADSFYRMYCFQPEYIEKMNGALRQAGLPE
ncbi:TolB-like protein/tetratricopeptide (TPR) repeat protein [Bradyrhizobium sp. USDA 4503]